MGTVRGWGLALLAATAPVAIAACGAEEGGGAGTGGAANASASLEQCDSPRDELMIGATLPMSGSGAPYGSMFAKSLELAVEDANEDGGIGGEIPIRLKVLDSKALAGPAVQQMRQLVDGDDAQVIVSGYNDPPLAQATLAQQMKIPVFNGGGNGVDLAGHPFLWNNVAAIDQEIARVQQYAKDELGMSKMAILAATNYTTADLDGIQQTAEEIFGAENVKMVKFDPEVTDVKPQLQEIKAWGPDGVTFVNSGALTITAAKNASEIDLGVPILGTSGTLYEPNILEQPSMEGAVASAMDFQPPKDFAKRVEQATGVPANAFQDNYASIVNVVEQAGEELLAEGNCVNGANINEIVRQHAEAGEPFEGYAGPVAYTPEGGSARELKILEVQDGEIVEVEGGEAPAAN